MLSWHNILNSRQIAVHIEEKLASQGEVFRRGISCIYLSFQTNGNHAMEPSVINHVISEQHWKSTFDFTKIVNNHGLKRGTVCQIVIFISQFSLKLYIKFWKYFHSAFKGVLVRKSIFSDTTYVWVLSR